MCNDVPPDCAKPAQPPARLTRRQWLYAFAWIIAGSLVLVKLWSRYQKHRRILARDTLRRLGAGGGRRTADGTLMAGTGISDDLLHCNSIFLGGKAVTDEDLACLAERARFLYETTDKAILGWGFGISFMGLSAILSDNITQGALDEWLCMLMTEKGTAHEMMARAVDASISCLKLVREAVGDRCFAWGIASDDAGTQRGELIAPDLFAEMIVPHYRRLCDWVHSNTSWKTFLHSCGSIYHYIQLWIDAGIDILNPVQTSAANMEPERLKREFGDRMRVFKPGGGFVFTQVHNIQSNVPPENVIAMFDAAHEFGAARQDIRHWGSK